ncbi:MAG: hypothetical protein ACW98Y_13615 [Candidatus Thorarchaeota archaeon]|jgi:hypothetical protein
MNRLSHLMFAFSLFVGLYSLVYAFTVWQSDIAQLTEFAFYYVAGGIGLSVVATPLLYWRAPHKHADGRTCTNRGAVSAVWFITFCIGSLGGSLVYQWISGVVIIGHISIFIGAVIMMAGATIPDWDIVFMGISSHRNVIFHSAILPFVVTLMTLLNVAYALISSSSFNIGPHIEYYVAALFLLGYASHLYLDIFPSDASPLEILWKAVNPLDKAPTGLKQFGPIKISRKGARSWLVGNATLLVMVALALMALYFYNLNLPP